MATLPEGFRLVGEEPTAQPEPETMTLPEGFSLVQQETVQPQPETEIQSKEPELIPSAPPTDLRQMSTLDQVRAISDIISPTPTAEEAGPLDAISMGYDRGIQTVLRGLGIAEPESEQEKAYMEILKERHPYTAGAGEIVGESVPFIGAGAAASKVGQTLLPKLGAFGQKALSAGQTLTGRLAGAGTLGTIEGGILAKGKDENVERGAVEGGLVAAGLEATIPVVGRLAGKLYRSVMGKTPKGTLIDEATGRPTQEFQQVLNKAGMSFDDFTQNAQDILEQQKAGVVPEQAARSALFEEAGVRATRGEITQKAADQARESRLMQSTKDELAEPLRQFKLKQSDEIGDYLRSNVNQDVFDEETGNLIKEAVGGRKKLLSTEKNQLYADFREATKGVEIPLFLDRMKESLPDEFTMEDLAITAEGPMQAAKKIMTRYGILEPDEDMLSAGVNPRVLTAENFDQFRKSLNNIERGDQTGAVKVVTGPLKEALDKEADELASVLESQGYGSDITDPIKQARQRVSTIKTEFSPQSAVGKLIDSKKDGNTSVIEASKLYSNNIAAKSVPVENVRSIMSTLNKAGESGEVAKASLQSTVMMDLINAGYGTKSKKINGNRVFNPIAFKDRMEALGWGTKNNKLQAIFKDNPDMLGRLKNIDNISDILIRNADVEPKGSSSTILDMFDMFGITAITSKIPVVGPMFNETIKTSIQRDKTRKEVAESMRSTPELVDFSLMLDSTFPAIAEALGVSATSDESE